MRVYNRAMGGTKLDKRGGLSACRERAGVQCQLAVSAFRRRVADDGRDGRAERVLPDGQQRANRAERYDSALCVPRDCACIGNGVPPTGVWRM